MSSRKCKYDADAFCYISYEAYFNRPVRNQHKTWAPEVACNNCKRCLEGWYRGEKRSMKFAKARIWREPKDHVNDRYFCIVNPSKRQKIDKYSIDYKNHYFVNMNLTNIQ
ncbi:uncharacterized protein LOC143192661 [Rhynchophorus ferrugineus]|uniref:uncharacterized protein LOC143192661 n=1 Tax=Rhynchophorus ferrugineus TaxID=354439 RepID=UPI003FCC367B